MSVKLTDKTAVTTMSDSDSVLGLFGGKVAPMSIADFRSHMNDDDNQVLNDLAFYIDVNSASSKGSTRVDVGGNDHMRQLWEDSKIICLMDASGNYCRLNRTDSRYTVEGEPIVDLTTGALLSKWAKCDVMVIVPQFYGHVQTVTVGATTKLRPWFSLVPLPNGYIIPQMVVGKFKASLVSGAMRSIPNAVPDNTHNINTFWNQAQVRSKNHGLANLDFRNYLLFHMMSKYGWRDSQNCKTADGTLVWGVGLDGTESTGSDKFVVQKGIKTGHTLSLGLSDGKVAVTDNNGTTVHGVNVAGFENPWGQYWEMVQGLCAMVDTTDVYCWRGNFMPTASVSKTRTKTDGTTETRLEVTDADFTKVECVKLTRPTTAQWAMNIIANQEGQGVYMIPKESASGISYGDNYWYANKGVPGQLWLFGGSSNNGSYCGLASAYSNNAWSYSSASISARLAFYGSVNEVSPTRLAELVA